MSPGNSAFYLFIGKHNVFEVCIVRLGFVLGLDKLCRVRFSESDDDSHTRLLVYAADDCRFLFLFFGSDGKLFFLLFLFALFVDKLGNEHGNGSNYLFLDGNLFFLFGNRLFLNLGCFKLFLLFNYFADGKDRLFLLGYHVYLFLGGGFFFDLFGNLFDLFGGRLFHYYFGFLFDDGFGFRLNYRLFLNLGLLFHNLFRGSGFFNYRLGLRLFLGFLFLGSHYNLDHRLAFSNAYRVNDTQRHHCNYNNKKHCHKNYEKRFVAD